MALETHFNALGFSDNERAVYLDLVSVGRSTAHMIAKRLGIARPTVYWVLETLGQKGVVAIERIKGVTNFSANQPESLLRLVQQEREKILAQLDGREQAARHVVDSVRPLFKRSRQSPTKLQFFEGSENIEAMLYDYLPVWQDSMAKVDHTWWGYQDPTFAAQYLKWLKHTWKVRRPQERDKILTNNLEVEQLLSKIAPHRGVRFIAQPFQTSMWVTGEYIVMIMTAHKPYYAMQLQNADFAANIRMVFELLWKELEEK